MLFHIFEMQTFHRLMQKGVFTCFGGLVTYKTSNTLRRSVFCCQNIHLHSAKIKLILSWFFPAFSGDQYEVS